MKPQLLLPAITLVQTNKIEQVKETACLVFGLQANALDTPIRKRPYPDARYCVMYILRYQFNMSLIDIAYNLGLTHHATILAGLTNFLNLYETNETFKLHFNIIAKHLGLQLVQQKGKRQKAPLFLVPDSECELDAELSITTNQ